MAPPSQTSRDYAHARKQAPESGQLQAQQASRRSSLLPKAISPPRRRGSDDGEIDDLETGSAETMPLDPSLDRQSENGPLVKVTSLALAGGRLTRMPITTLQFPMQNYNAFLSGTKLSDIRERLASIVQKNATFAFCSDEAAVAASEDATLASYARTIEQDDEDEDHVFHIFILPTNEPAQRQGAVLLKPPFQLKFIQKGETVRDSVNTGALHSSSFQGRDPSHLPMSELRRMVGKMSTSSQIHTFCSKDGSAATDQLTLLQYLALDNEGIQETEGTPSILILYRKTDDKVAAPEAASKFHGASQEVLAAMERLRPDLTIRDRSAEELKVDKTAFRVQEELNASQFAARDATPSKQTSKMDEADWDTVLRNCNLLYGWKINKKTGRIERAAVPAFRLKVKAAIAPPSNLLVVPPESVVAIMPNETKPSRVSTSPTTTTTTTATDAGSPTTTTTTATDAGSPPVDSPKVTQNTAVSEPSSTPDGVPTATTVDEPAALAAAISLQPPPLTSAEDIAAIIPAKLGAIPSYVINDQSRIAVTVVSSEFQESMAKNHFDSSSVEASVSGGYAGYSAGVTGGAATDNSKMSVNNTKTFSKRMIGSYMFPRVDVTLRPEDMEPTEELRSALRVVHDTKDINNLRKLYATFGHLFCHKVTLGGCLQTTKIVTGSQDNSESLERESFKASVGVAFTTPIRVNGSAKASHETSDSASNYRAQTNTSESLSFEATGGNSILAADPPAWSGSVADFNNWRIINQTELTPIVEAIAGMSGYGLVKKWFLLAAPKLSQYYVIPDSRVLHVRFKVADQNDSFARVTGRGIHDQAYLGVDPAHPPKPMRMGLERLAPESYIRREIRNSFLFWTSYDMTRVTTQVDLTTKDAMFFPYSTQAPVLMFPSGKEVGTREDKRLGQTLWRLEVANGYSLGPDCLVCVKSCAPVTTSADKDAAEADLALTVYRNAQGTFMPSISSSDEPCYWRLRRMNDAEQRAGDAAGVKRAPQESFRHGESFRLTWSFSDQSSGFRDYTNDLYGRRSFQKPNDMAQVDTLCLKIPYPRFESSGNPISLVLSPALTEKPIVQPIKVRRKKSEGEGADVEVNYVLYDVGLRVDCVGNGGVGDSLDFMNIVTDAREERRVVKSWEGSQSRVWRTATEGSPEAMLAGVLLGPMARPIAGIASILDGIIGF